MRNPYAVDSLLSANLAKTSEGNEYVLLLEQAEMLFLAFEKKIITYSTQELRHLHFCLQTYVKLEKGANNYITKTYLRLLIHYLKNKD